MLDNGIVAPLGNLEMYQFHWKSMQFIYFYDLRKYEGCNH